MATILATIYAIVVLIGAYFVYQEKRKRWNTWNTTRSLCECFWVAVWPLTVSMVLFFCILGYQWTKELDEMERPYR